MKGNNSLKPKISILLPVFNGQQYLHACIQSVLKQDLTNFELIIGDDHSTDDSSAIIQSFSDIRIRYYRWEKNLGLFPNLNQLVAKSQSPLVRFLGQDDLLKEDCLRNEVDLFTSNPTIGMSFCKTIFIDAKGCITGHGILNDLPEVITPQFSNQLFYYYGCIPGNISTVCARRDCFDTFGGFNENYKVAGDYEMWVRICQQKDLGVIHKHLIELRQHDKQLSVASSSGKLFIAETRKIRAQLLSLLPLDIQVSAKQYENRRHTVLDVHYAIRCLFQARFSDWYIIFCILGWKDWLRGFIYWFITGNNHWLKPNPVFSSISHIARI